MTLAPRWAYTRWALGADTACLTQSHTIQWAREGVQARGEDRRREDHAMAGRAMPQGDLVVSAAIGLLRSYFVVRESGS